MNAEKSFVFHDPSGKRWRRFRRSLQVTGILSGGALVILGLAIFSSPQLPALGLPRVEHLANLLEVRGIIRGERAAKNVPFIYDRNVKYVRSPSPVIHPRIAPKPNDSQPVVFGFFVNWDDASKVSLRLNLGRMTHLVPEWLTLANAKGEITDESDPTIIKIAADAHMPVLALLTNFRGGWQAGDLHQVLLTPASREELVENIHFNIVEHKFAGINIDFEQLDKRDSGNLVEFMRMLKAKLEPEHLLVTECVPTDDEAYDLKRLGAINDYTVAMVYDEHYQSSSPGPVASQNWFDNELERLSKVLPGGKTIIGIGNYGYDWVIGGQAGREVTFGDVISAARQNKAQIQWDGNTKNPVLRYTSNSGQHEVWFLDATSALNQVNSVSDEGFRGMAVWRLGSEDPGLWKVLARSKWPTIDFPGYNLFELTAQEHVNHYGEGEVLRVASTPRKGTRNVWKNSDDDYAEEYKELPAYYDIERSGAGAPKTLALTFDDGPDTDFTPQVLDILKRENAPAAFFVVGVNAERYPSLIKRAFLDGHLLGNHTYTHPNIATVSEDRTRIELSLTQRLIEHDTGSLTTLFRPPYNADSEPQTPEEVLPLLRAQQMNYITISESIDPRDWEAGVTADKIVEEVVKEAQAGGHVILLHDAGGDRSATVAALPRIIDTLRQLGYTFVSLEQLMGKTRAQIMPSPTKQEARLAEFEGGALDTQSAFKSLVGLLFLCAIYLTLCRSVVFGILAIVQKWKARKRQFDSSYRPDVSVIIAAYNEDKVIVRTVRSILDNGYDGIEVIVVDDGSKDQTLQVLRDAFGSDPCVRILTQPNGGKSSALNHGIAQAKYEVLVACDADTIFRKKTIEYLIRHFADPKVAAVSGNARVGNRQKWLTKFQSIEYICGFNLDRRALDMLNAITVVPGAVGAWRKQLILDLGGFGDDTLAEDTDITLAIRRLGHEIRYEEKGVAYTEAPETTRALAKQRFRWAFGTLQAAWKHRDATFDPQYGFLGLVALPSIWIFQVLLAILSPLAELAMILALWAGNWRIVLLYYFGFFVLELCTALLAYSLEGESPWDLSLLFFQRIYFRQLMNYVLFKSMVYAMRGRLVGWGKLERTASVKA